MRAIIYLYIMVFLFSLASASYLFPPIVRANEAQHHICKAGLNIGQAQARAELYGQANGGVIPPAQLTAIEANLTTASAEMTTAEGLFVEPFVSYRAEHGMPANALSEIARYPEFTAGWSYQHRTAYIRTIYGMYRNGLAVTYVSDRDDDLEGFRKLPNCDSTTFQFCYYYGMATIASEVGGHYARGAQTEANGSFRRTVQTGLKIAMDRGVVPGDPGHLPDDGITKKVCCTFGTPKTWEGMGLSVFQWNSPTALYVMNSVPILGIIGNAVELDPICEPERGICASSRVHKRKQRGGGSGFTGRWKCVVFGEDAIMGIKQNGNSATMTETPTGRVYQGQVSGDTAHFVVPDSSDISGTIETRYTCKLRAGGNIIDFHGQLYKNGREDNTIIGPFDFSCSRVTN